MRKPNLNAIRRRVAAASPGPWRVGSQDPKHGDVLHAHELVISHQHGIVELEPHRNGAADTAFIAHARQDIPALLAEVERLRSLITPREAAALDRLLQAYLATEEGDAGADDLRALYGKVRRLDQDHTVYDKAFGDAGPSASGGTAPYPTGGAE